MRRIALVIGIIWLAGLAVAGAALLTSGQFQNVRGLMYAQIGAAIPGILVLHWGLGKKQPVRPSPKIFAPKAPYDHAAEAGHVVRIGTPPHA